MNQVLLLAQMDHFTAATLVTQHPFFLHLEWTMGYATVVMAQMNLPQESPAQIVARN